MASITVGGVTFEHCDPDTDRERWVAEDHGAAVSLVVFWDDRDPANIGWTAEEYDIAGQQSELLGSEGLDASDQENPREACAEAVRFYGWA